MSASYKIARDNIKKRRDRILRSTDSISNVSIIKNQESDGIHVLSEQMPNILNNSIIPPIPSQNSEGIPQENIKSRSILKLLNKYKFWIIAAIILALLLFMAIKLYMDNQYKSDELEVVSVSNLEISSSNPTESPVNPLIAILGRSKESAKTSSVLNESFSTEIPNTVSFKSLGGAPSLSSTQIPLLQGPLPSSFSSI
jgi:hypothetical protein